MNYSTSQLNNLDIEEFLEHLDCVSDTTLLSIIKRYKATSFISTSNSSWNSSWTWSACKALVPNSCSVIAKCPAFHAYSRCSFQKGFVFLAICNRAQLPCSRRCTKCYSIITRGYIVKRLNACLTVVIIKKFCVGCLRVEVSATK